MATGAAGEVFAVAGASKVFWVLRSDCTHIEEVCEPAKPLRDKVREGSRALDWILKDARIDGRDRESCCGRGSIGVEDENVK